MNKIKKIGYVVALSGVLLVVFSLLQPTENIGAQACSANASPGNLFGYLMTENLPNDPIYLSKDSWNDDPLNFGHAPTTVDFYVITIERGNYPVNNFGINSGSYPDIYDMSGLGFGFNIKVSRHDLGQNILKKR